MQCLDVFGSDCVRPEAMTRNPRQWPHGNQIFLCARGAFANDGWWMCVAHFWFKGTRTYLGMEWDGWIFEKRSWMQQEPAAVKQHCLVWKVTVVSVHDFTKCWRNNWRMKLFQDCLKLLLENVILCFFSSGECILVNCHADRMPWNCWNYKCIYIYM